MHQVDSRNPLPGSWTGRLLDIGGLEAELVLSLRGDAAGLNGVFDVMITGQHRPVRLRGLVQGQIVKRRLVLKLDSGQKDSPVDVQFEGSAHQTHRGRWTLCGRYAVSVRRPSPLLGGVLCAWKATAPDKDQGVLLRSVSPASVGTPHLDPTRGRATSPRKKSTTKQRKRKKSSTRRGRRKSGRRSQ